MNPLPVLLPPPVVDATLPPVLVFGAGAVGCIFGALLARAGVPVTLVGRPALAQAVQAQGGLRVEAPLLGLDAILPMQVAAEDAAIDAALAQAALVLVCVKSGDTEATGDRLRAHLRADARVLSLQNGVDNAPRLAARLGRPVGPAIVYVASGMAGPGHVRHQGRGELVIGPQQGPGLDAQALVALFARAAVPVTVSDQVLGALWAKLVVNCVFNPWSAATGQPYGVLWAQPGGPEQAHACVDECLAVAAALGVQVSGDAHAAVEHIARSMPGQRSSTWQDLQRGKPTEVQHLNGLIVREAARLGIAVPVNAALLAAVAEAEAEGAGPPR